MKKLMYLVTLVTSLSLASVAHANHIHVFPLWDDVDTTVAEQMQFVDGDLSMTVSAWTASFNSSQTQLEAWTQVTGAGLGVYRDDNGLGVISSDSDGNDLDGGSSSNYASDPDEGLLLVFSEEVELLDVFVGDLDRTDEINFSVVDLSVPSQPFLTQSVIDETGPAFFDEWPFEFADDFIGSAFMLWVDGGSDDVEMLGIAVATIPVPATLLLMLSGLLALVLGRRK